MIRAFTISFDFKGRTYLALASTKTKDNEVSYFVRVYDHALYQILPEGHLEYTSEGMVNQRLTHPLAKQLFHCIDESIACHLKAAQLQ